VVELFTSQGCSRCPPADALMVDLAKREDIVALSYHVDYWDYLGWKDRLAAPENTARQQAYGEALDNTVYTPQAIVNGRRNVVGSSRSELLEALESVELSVDIGLSAVGQSLFIDIGGSKEQALTAHVILVNYEPRQVVRISGGENEGKTVDYRNIVTGFRTLAMWHGKPLRLELPKSEIDGTGEGCAVLLQVQQDGLPGPILGAARSYE